MTTKKEPVLDIVTLLADLVVFNSYSFDEFLTKLIKLITGIIPVNSCLIYFYDRQHKQLILCGSKKSHNELMGKIYMEKGEGITGWVAEHKQTVVLKKEAYTDPRFKHFEELPEDKYEAFLSVPIVDKEGVVGVVNLQHRAPYGFSDQQIQLIEAVVKIISSAFENIMLERKVGHLEDKLEERKIVERAKGLLMKKIQISEKQAFTMIRTESMKKRKTMKEIAEAVILLYE